MINILLADDHHIITEGITNLLADSAEINVVLSCENGEEVLEKLPHPKIDIILLDIDMPKMNGIDCAETLLKQDPDIKIAMLTMHQEKALIQRFLEMGVKGYFLKTIVKSELEHALKTIASGGEYFPANVTKALLQKQSASNDSAFAPSPLLTELSERETEIITLIANGYSTKEIGEHLFISHRTVDTHRTNIMRKLEINNIAGLVRFAFQNKMVS